MIKSMTGFGKSKIAFADGYLKVEIKTFNHKFFELSSKTPDNLQIFEEKIKKIIREHITRGRIYLNIIYDKSAERNSNIIVDGEKLKRYYNLLLGIKKEFRLKDEITLAQLFSFPEIIIYKPRKENINLLWRSTQAALKMALNALVKMRQKEGQTLYKDFLMRAKAIERSLQKIKKLVPQEVERYKHKLKSRMRESLSRSSALSERWQQEIALLAKNYDVSEEITRLHAHIDNFKNILREDKEAGKVLDFIAQELHREINTIGAKSADLKISKEVIFIKGEIEKIREQIQNIE